jgi:hypothetical protein
LRWWENRESVAAGTPDLGSGIAEACEPLFFLKKQLRPFLALVYFALRFTRTGWRTA